MIHQAVHHHSPPSHHPLFSCGLELADLAVTSDLLHHSWSAISALSDAGGVDSTPTPTTQFSRFSIRYRTSQQSNYTVIAFASSASCREGGGEVLIPSPTLEYNPLSFDFLCSKDNPTFAINQGAITLFMSLFDHLSKLHHQLGNSSSLLITGHSLGGSVASLFTLWLLENIPLSTTNLPLCITFGSPLLGDDGLSRAISDRQTWNSRFLHVVSNQDIIPSQFILPHNSSLQTSDYKPFGTFLMCSQLGCACVEDPESVLELMLKIRDLNEGSSLVVDYVDYGEVLEHLKCRIVYKGVSELRGSTSSLSAGMAIQLEAIGLKKTQQENSEFDALIAAMENRERANYFDHKRRISDPAKKLNEIKRNMALLEWYKKASKGEGMGYYDCYKSRRTQRDMDVVKYKNILTNYWSDTVTKAERNPQKKGVFFRTRWLYAGTNYRRMVEPLDIADYYKMPGRKEYKTQGRRQHYILLERWQEEVEKATEIQKAAKTRNTACSLTEDSCFWAHVEEAIILTKSLRNGEEAGRGTEEPSRANLMNFESYVMGLINNFAVSPETFLEKSSFMQWWKQFELILEPGYSSFLTEFMRSHSYRQYA